MDASGSPVTAGLPRPGRGPGGHGEGPPSRGVQGVPPLNFFLQLKPLKRLNSVPICAYDAFCLARKRTLEKSRWGRNRQTHDNFYLLLLSPPLPQDRATILQWLLIFIAVIAVTIYNNNFPLHHSTRNAAMSAFCFSFVIFMSAFCLIVPQDYRQMDNGRLTADGAD